MSSEVQDKLLDFISEHFRIPRNEIDPETSLVDQGVIDSFGFVEIVAFLEETFRIAIADEQINGENFGSVRRIVSFVTALSGSALHAHERPLAR
jgi:acyl carrier protein